MTRTLALAALLLGCAGCIPEEGPMMSPGEDCMECHGGGEAPRWTLAGTMKIPQAELVITDGTGKTFTRHTNRVGNFWTTEPVTFPLRVRIGTEEMPQLVQASSRGSCNTSCHSHSGAGGD